MDMNEMRRREFLGMLGKIFGAGAVFLYGPDFVYAEKIKDTSNPLMRYPNRDWEKIYRDQYRYDRTFQWVCMPNDTHACRLRAFVRNGVVVRSEQNYDVHRYTDLYGNRMTEAWHPRGCPKGLTMQDRVYGKHRLKSGPVIRKGWKRWADDGFPSLSDAPHLRDTYKFTDRGNDDFVRVTWDEASRYAAMGILAIARTYSGEEGKRRLLKDGYPEEMLLHWSGAGTRTMAAGSSLPLHGIVGKFGIFRFANMLSLVDAYVRGVGSDEAKGSRDLTEYTWRGDQAPGFPFVHGLQTSDCDFSDVRHSRLLIHCGKNLVENKMPESHWANEIMERGGKVVCIGPDYSAPSAKADYWIGARPGLSDTAIFLAVAKIIMDRGWYDGDFVKRFTDLPLLVRTDTLKRLRPQEIFPNYVLKDISGGPSFREQGLKSEQREQMGDFVARDARSGRYVAVSREDLGKHFTTDPVLEGSFEAVLLDGTAVEVMPVFEMYKRHLADYDVATAAEISGAKPELIERLARDLATIKPAAIHIGEGINHYFHATLHNRLTFLVMMLTGNIGKHGAGVFTWAGNYKGGIFQASSWTGPGAGSYFLEDPFNPVLDEHARITKKNIRNTIKGQEVAYWAFGDRPQIVDTPKGRKCFTGKTHMPSPTKMAMWNNANLLNQAKWAYDMIQNTNPLVDMLVDIQVEFTASAEYSDLVFPANTWMEQQDIECSGSCSNPFIQIWGQNGIPPVHNSRDDAEIFAGISRALADSTGDRRFRDYWKFVTEKKAHVYIQRVFDNSTTTRGEKGPYSVEKILAGSYGNEPGAALMLTRTYPRVPFVEQVEDSVPFYTDTGRMNAYCDLPEAIEYGENLISHREAVEATPYMPNVIVSTSPYIRPEDYGISPDTADADLRAVRNIKMPWSEVKKTVNPLWAQGFQFFCLTPKSRHTVHSSWSTVEKHLLLSSNFGDADRADIRQPNVGDSQIQMNPQAAKDRGIADGDYVFVDANPADRPFRGWQKDPARYKAFRCMVRVKYNPALPYHVTIMKHTGWIATERTVRAHETRSDKRAISRTGYEASYRYGSHQSITRGWFMPMHQTDTLWHKKAGAMEYVRGFDVDNHAVNTVPKETLVTVTKAEDGGRYGRGRWNPSAAGRRPGNENEAMKRYLAGGFAAVR